MFCSLPIHNLDKRASLSFLFIKSSASKQYNQNRQKEKKSATIRISPPGLKNPVQSAESNQQSWVKDKAAARTAIAVALSLCSVLSSVLLWR